MSKFGMKRSKSSQKLLASGSETSQDQVKLEKVLGISVSSGASLSCDQHSGIVAYPAGCTVVLYNGKNGVQRHLINAGRKTITCLSFSPDGKYLATGECGHEPCVRVWDVEDGKQISELKGHKFGVCCVAFSPKNKHLVSVGNQHDQTVNVWNWKTQAKLATNKISSKVRAISLSESGQYFVTVGVRHVKFWYVEKTKPSPVVSKYKDNTAVPLQGRSAILSDQRNNLFCDVLCGQGQLAGKTYCITQKGLLCEFNARRLLDRWVDLKTSSSNCIALGSGKLFVGCASGVVRVFDAQSLQYLMSLPQPHYLGVDVAAGTSPQHMIARPRAARYPDTLALCFDRQLTRLTCVYSDHSIYQWDVSDLKRVGKAQSHLYHCGCVWTVETYPNRFSDSEILPPGTFLTCGSDETVRIWNCDTSVGPCTSSGFTAESPFGAFPGRNIYSPELMKIMYLGQDVQNLVDSEATLGAGNTTTDRASDIGQLDGKSGIRSIRVSPEGLHLATGNRNGNVRVYDLQNMNLLMDQEAHDADVLCLEYSDVDGGAYLMASGSRDRVLHVFDISNGYQPVGTIDDHSSSITCIKFVRKGADQNRNRAGRRDEFHQDQSRTDEIR